MTSRPAWIASFNVTSTPMPAAAGLAASATALNRFIGPSAESAEAGRIEPVITTGFAVRAVSVRKYADSSSASVPCVTTIPSTSSRAASALMRRASASQLALVRCPDSTWNSCSPRTSATPASDGTAAISASAPMDARA
jgi:hypothetical protein